MRKMGALLLWVFKVFDITILIKIDILCSILLYDTAQPWIAEAHACQCGDGLAGATSEDAGADAHVIFLVILNFGHCFEFVFFLIG